MTKIRFFRKNGVIYGFEEIGHTGYGEAGEDPLCAALSSMTMFIVNAIELSYDSKVEYDVNDDDTKISVRSKAALIEFEDSEKIRYAVSGIFFAYYCQIKDLVEEYYDYLDVKVIDKDYDDDD